MSKADENPEVLVKRAADEMDLALGRLVAALVATFAGIITLWLARTQVAFVVGVMTTLAGIGWFFAVKRAARAVRSDIVTRLTLDGHALVLDEARRTRIAWSDVTAIEIDDDAGGIEVHHGGATTAIAPGFGGLALEPLYAKLCMRWRSTRGDAQP